MKSIKMFFLSISIVLIGSIAISAQDESKTIPLGVTRTLSSKIMGEDRPIHISLPMGYDRSQRRYPVLFLTDGHVGNLMRSAGLIHYLSPHEIPRMIVVAIPNTDRGRDLSVFPLEQLPNSGGADRFLRFITDELIPFIDGEFRTTGYRIIYGASAGGQFVTYSLVNASDYFDGFIASSPALGFGNGRMLKIAERFFRERKSLKKTMIIPFYDRDFTICFEPIPVFTDIVAACAPPDFQLVTIPIPGKSHVPAMSLKDGLLAMFSDWEPALRPRIVPSHGTFLKSENLSVKICGKGEIRYTLDGTEPTRQSSLYEMPIMIQEPVTVKAKVFDGRLYESATAEGVYQHAHAMPAISDPIDLKQGLRYQYFERDWYMLPDTIHVQPQKTGIISNFDLSPRLKTDGYLFQFDGFIQIQKSGLYTFTLKSDCLCKLFIDDELKVTNRALSANNDPMITAEEWSNAMVLDEGFHRIRVQYTDPWFLGSTFQVLFQGPGIEKQMIPSNLLFYED